VWGWGCGSPETEDHIFLKTPMLGSIWREVVRYLGVFVALAEEGQSHLALMKNLVPGNAKIREKFTMFLVVS
jgi:hypothetical protein